MKQLPRAALQDSIQNYDAMDVSTMRTFARVIHRPDSFQAAVRSASQFWPRCVFCTVGKWRTCTYSKTAASTQTHLEKRYRPFGL
jgi:hypothetical protein